MYLHITDTKQKIVWYIIKNAMLDQHGNLESPATCASNNSRTPIDAIFILESLNCEQSGYLGFDQGSRSDHRALWIDLEYKEVFNFSSPPLHCPGRKRLHNRDPRLIKKYCKQVKKKLLEANIPNKLFALEQEAKRCGWNRDLKSKYNRLHKQNEEIRKLVEKKIRKLPSGGIPWSPKLQKYRDTIELWRLVV